MKETGLSGPVCAGQTGQRVSPLVSWSEAGADWWTELSPGWRTLSWEEPPAGFCLAGVRQQGRGREQVLGSGGSSHRTLPLKPVSDGPTPPALGGCNFPATMF